MADEPSDRSAQDDLPCRIRRGMALLQSLRDGDQGVVAITSCGEAAIPGLYAFARRRDPSGLYHARCRAVEALAALHAANELHDLLTIPLDRPDPVERTGDEAVVNAAARALGRVKDPAAWPLLLALSRRRHLTGVIEAIGRFGDSRAIPALIDALAEDCSRPVAEEALLRHGGATIAPLLAIANRPHQSVSGLRQRRAAARLLCAMDVPMCRELRALADAADPELRATANIRILAAGNKSERSDAAGRLIDLLRDAAWPLTIDIEAALAAHRDGAADQLQERLTRETDPQAAERLHRLSRRIAGP